MSSGLTSTLPEPIVSAASCASSDGVGIEPVNEDSCSRQDEPRPNPVAARDSPVALSRRDSPANAVPQPRAKSARNDGRLPSPRAGGSLVNVWPPTSLALVHGTGSPTDSPLSSSAAVETIVNAC